MDGDVIDNINGAINILIEFFKKNNEIWLMTLDHNKGRHKEIITNKGKYYLMYKNASFEKFGEIFKTDDGWGESLNREFLAYCLNKKIDKILIAYQNGKIYWATPIKWLEIAKEGNYIRESEMEDIRVIDSQKTVIHELTYSVPLRKLERFNI